jgi:tetratricopeptide (TPR) repeat protein
MSRLKTAMKLVLCTLGFAAVLGDAAEVQTFDDELASIRHEFDVASFSGMRKSDRKRAFADLVEHAEAFSGNYPNRVEAIGWNGIVLSAYAGEVSALGAMKVAKSALAALESAEAIDPAALDGGIYASLGALYSKVPGGMMGFGDDDIAAEYFKKALEVDADNIDSNFFYGEFLIDQKQYEQALTVLNHALAAPEVTERPLFDAGRRAKIRALLEEAWDNLPRSAER